MSSYTRSLSIRVPKNVPWNPEGIQQLMVSWFSLPEFLRLLIKASASAITWHVEIPYHQETPLLRNLYASYPNAQVTVTDKTDPALGYRLFQYRGTAPFIYPMLTVTEFPQIDSLNALISALGSLEADEAVNYEITLLPVRTKVADLGREMVNELIALTANDLTETQKQTNYEKQLAEAKINAPLKEVSLSLKIKAESVERTQAILDTLIPALVIHERPGINSLRTPNETSYSLVLSAGEVAGFWHLPTETCEEPRVIWAPRLSVAAPVALTQQKSGTLLGTNCFQNKEQEVWLPDSSRATHINIIGRTGTGKTTLLHQMIHQDIQAGKGVAVIDPHGDLVEAILQSSIPTDRESDVIVFDISDQEFPIGLNLLKAPQNLEGDLVASYALDVIRKMFADDWSPTRMETALYAALGALIGTENTSLWDVSRLFHNSAFRVRILEQVTDPHILDYWYSQFEPASENLQRQIADPINYRLGKFYRNPAIRRVVCQPHCLDFRAILDSKKIFLAKLGGIMDIDMETLGALIISKFELAAISRGEIPPDSRGGYYLYIDEVQSFVTTSLAKMFSQARKFGLRLVVANQYLRQLETDVLDSIMGNVGASIVFRPHSDDARTLASFFQPQFSVDQVANLDKYQAILKMQYGSETQPAFDIKTLPPLNQETNSSRMIRATYLRQLSREKYGRPGNEVDEELNRWTQQWRPARSTSRSADGGAEYLG